MAFPISTDDFSELKPPGKLFKVAKAFTNDSPRGQIPFFGISVSLADKPLHHAGQCPAIWLCPRREVSGHLRIKPSGLSAGRVNAAIRCQIREHHDEAFLQGDEADQVHEERLARSVFPDDEPDRRSAI